MRLSKGSLRCSSGSALKKKDAERVAYPIPANVHAETVVSVRHYTDRLFSFRITRPQSFRFRSGEFVMIGLPNAEKPVFRAYSIASPAWDEEIEFFSIKVPDGPLTSELQKIVPGDTVLMRQKSTGTLVIDALTPAKRLFMISTGTGIAPFASLDPRSRHLREVRRDRPDAHLPRPCRTRLWRRTGRQSRQPIR